VKSLGTRAQLGLVFFDGHLAARTAAQPSASRAGAFAARLRANEASTGRADVESHWRKRVPRGAPKQLRFARRVSALCACTSKSQMRLARIAKGLLFRQHGPSLAPARP